jgi:hypothetical protein
MRPESRRRILAALDEGDRVLDVGGWAHPFARADWVIDLMPHETRGIYGEPDPDPERFTAETWVERDICDRAPWPFDDDSFDFAVCSHTLEDIRDPIWVCTELIRVARAGYIEVPSRLEEQSFGVHGPWVGWSHHRWLVDIADGEVEFVFKPHLLAGRDEFHIPAELGATLTPDERVQYLFWKGEFPFQERIFLEAETLDPYLIEHATAARKMLAPRVPRRSLIDRVRGRLRRLGGRRSD